MRLKKGKSIYKLPPDFINLESVYLSDSGFWEQIREISGARDSMSVLSKPDNYTVFWDIDGKYISFHPAPDKAYYIKLRYFTMKEV